MREVAILGIGQTPVGEHWDMGLRQLAFHALKAATEDAGIEKPEALFVANMLAERLSDQAHLGALIADFAGWRGIEATTVEAACASGGAAFQNAMRAVGMAHVVFYDSGRDHATGHDASAPALCRWPTGALMRCSPTV